MSLDLARHPCFNESARRTATRIHLPVAPLCNIQCKYCKRGYDCVNESRPGVTSTVLSPGQALRYLENAVQGDPRISVVGIAGPGDPFASPDATIETLKAVRQRFPELLLCVASNGLNLLPYANELAAVNITHVTLTVNAVDPAISENIYQWVRHEHRVYRGRIAAELLLNRQLLAIDALKSQGVIVKINAIIIPGINDTHIADIAREMANRGADIINCVPLYPVDDTEFASIPSPSAEMVESIRGAARRFLPTMEHCTRCRADAIGLLGEQFDEEKEHCLQQFASLPQRPNEDRPYVAVATAEGVLVNRHLGEVSTLSIFERLGDGFQFVEHRETPPPGTGQHRWRALADRLTDCRAVLIASAGESPRTILETSGLRVVMMEGLIVEGLDAVYRGREIRAPLRARHHCGSGCAGSGNGCG